MTGVDTLVWEARLDGTSRSPRLAPVRRAASATNAGTTEVRVRFSGLCGSDTGKLCSDAWCGPLPEGWVPGHEVVGIDTRTGTWVAVNPLVGCEGCAECALGRLHLCPGLRRVGWDLPGGLAESVRVPVRNAVPLTSGAADPAVFVLADPVAVALHGVRCGLPAPASSRAGRLGVIGAGTLGICTAVSAARSGWDVFLATRRPGQEERLRTLLADTGVTVCPESGLPAGTCDAVVDAASGHSAAPLLQALEAVRDGGTILVQNAYAPQVKLSTPLREVFRRSITLRGSYSHCRANNGDDFRDALQLLVQAADSAWATALTSTRYPLARLPDALAALHPDAAHRPPKVLLTFRR
ncbi:alcohol dehydrogenase catalytic domain-containing protein [Kitasatospora sp. MAP5-34]|uniref:alcohol dehydrogenase catalytic domain-containing protein n=1 Tax=Kitasatospora sp. MAP5-34 TaxID=3035102 RepID=UPI002475EF98|nr:alcohol dehydrogenase catalytic domain-containing protein [Kitasatospora sp. MAP5-34]MDH6580317.1 threonine dehydrogenase-like Zn-dependent dehydrogenase [Kitasatospora sp. MAP5-34]